MLGRIVDVVDVEVVGRAITRLSAGFSVTEVGLNFMTYGLGDVVVVVVELVVVVRLVTGRIICLYCLGCCCDGVVVSGRLCRLKKLGGGGSTIPGTSGPGGTALV